MHSQQRPHIINRLLTPSIAMRIHPFATVGDKKEFTLGSVVALLLCTQSGFFAVGNKCTHVSQERGECEFGPKLAVRVCS